MGDGVPDVLKAAPVLSGLAEGDVHLAAERVGVDGGGGDGVGVLLGPLERGEHVRACVFDDWVNGGGDVTSGSCTTRVGASLASDLFAAPGLPRERRTRKHATGTGRTGEGEQDGDDDEPGGEPAGRRRRRRALPASGGAGGSLRHVSRGRAPTSDAAVEVTTSSRCLALSSFSPLSPALRLGYTPVRLPMARGMASNTFAKLGLRSGENTHLLFFFKPTTKQGLRSAQSASLTGRRHARHG